MHAYAVHGLCVSLGSLFVIELGGIRIKDGESLDVFAFARGWRIERARFGKQIRTALEIGFRGAVPELVIEAHGLAPIGHCAGGVFLLDFLKLIAGGFVLERIEESHAALKLGLHGGSAGNREGDGAKLFGGVVVVVRFVLSEASGIQRKNDQKNNLSDVFHLPLTTNENVIPLRNGV